MKIMKMHLPSIATVLAILAALLFAKPAAAQIAPIITTQPESVSTTNNAIVTFQVAISGSSNMVSDWFLSGKYVFGTTNKAVLAVTNSLVLPDISTTNAGSYLVVITNDWGSITSSVATLTVTNATVVTNTPPLGTNSAPVILLQPRSVSTTNGATATFKVVISGSPNMVSDWYFNGQYVSGITNEGVLGATNSLVLPDISTTNAGSYLVVITNDWGSITSSVATLTVTNLSGGGIPRISILSGTPRGVTLNLLTLSGTSSRLWVATNLYPPVIWTPVATNVSGTNGIWQFTDTNASQYPVRFYRTSTP
jgi:hypothetical protein